MRDRRHAVCTIREPMPDTKLIDLALDQLSTIVGGQASNFDDGGGPFANRTINVDSIINTFGQVPGTFSPGTVRALRSRPQVVPASQFADQE